MSAAPTGRASPGTRLVRWGRAACSVLERLAGVPDYDGYLRHLHRRHPERTPMTRDEFDRDRLAHRYDRPGSRCC